MTVLRHPLERTVSYLRDHRRRTPADADLTLEEVYDDDLRFHGLIHNHMTKMLSLTPEEMDEGVLTRVEFTPERLERAKERLAARRRRRAAGGVRLVLRRALGALRLVARRPALAEAASSRSSSSPGSATASSRTTRTTSSSTTSAAGWSPSGPASRARSSPMYPLWDKVIAPVLRAAGARRVVEIGALQGETTVKLLDLLGPESEVHVIDPVPQFDPSEHERRFPGRYHFHRAISHDVLPELPRGRCGADRRRPQLVHGRQRAQDARRDRARGGRAAAGLLPPRRRLALRPPRPLLRARADPGGVPPAVGAEGAAAGGREGRTACSSAAGSTRR